MTRSCLRSAQTILAGIAFLLFIGPSLHAANRNCSSAATLTALANCISGQMPASGSNGFVAPTSTERADWQSVVRQMLQGQCGFVLPASLAGIAELRTFTDASNGKSYCLLMEILDANDDGRVDRGWGTFLVDANAAREVSHQAPHPIADFTTETQAIEIFRGTHSRSYLMAGSHRLANSGASTCQNDYGPADAAHNTDNMFHATNAELLAHYAGRTWTAIQWHGMAADTCVNVDAYLTHGRNVAPSSTDTISILKNNLLVQHPSWKVETPGGGLCSLNGTDNTQGRLLNGVDPSSVCSTAAASYNGSFVHIEQDPGFRAASDWITAVNRTWLAKGDVNASGLVEVTDVFYLINFLFANGAAPLGLGDTNGDSLTSVADVFYLINHLFAGGPPPR